MTQYGGYQIDPKRDLVLERVVDVAPERVWRAWTTPAELMKWFTPAPWKTVDCEIDPRPGGIFRTVMESPEGDRNEGTGCILEAIPNQRLIWTGALLPGFRPRASEPMIFSAIILIEPHGSGTKYTAIAIHMNEEDSAKHAEMGFHHGWGAALDQLVILAKSW
ncbi:MAG: SRPBCC family protein [Roseiflexaceae bacterium]